MSDNLITTDALVVFDKTLYTKERAINEIVRKINICDFRKKNGMENDLKAAKKDFAVIKKIYKISQKEVNIAHFESKKREEVQKMAALIAYFMNKSYSQDRRHIYFKNIVGKSAYLRVQYGITLSQIRNVFLEQKMINKTRKNKMILQMNGYPPIFNEETSTKENAISTIVESMMVRMMQVEEGINNNAKLVAKFIRFTRQKYNISVNEIRNAFAEEKRKQEIQNSKIRNEYFAIHKR